MTEKEKQRRRKQSLTEQSKKLRFKDAKKLASKILKTYGPNSFKVGNERIQLNEVSNTFSDFEPYENEESTLGNNSGKRETL